MAFSSAAPRARLRSLLSSALLVGAVLSTSALTPTGNAAFAATNDSILWGAYINAVPSDLAKVDAFEADAGKRAAILHWGQAWFRDGKYQPFPASYFQAARDHGSLPMVNWGSWDSCCGTDQPTLRLSEIVNGTHDAYITQWAQSARAWGHPFFLRFDQEMNGWWQFPWSDQANGNKPGEFVAAWRHVHDIFSQQGATNATWVWCPNISGSKTTPLSQLYPGGDYVNWTCMDGYNWGTDKGNRWQSFSDVFAGDGSNGSHNTYQEVLAIAPDKPIMIGEVATSRNGGDPGAWVRDALDQLPTSFPQIKALVWTNADFGDRSLYWPIQSTPAIQSAFTQGISASYFASNQFGAIDGGPIAAPAGFEAIATASPPVPIAEAPMADLAPEIDAG
jgi:hypothetical protein